MQTQNIHQSMAYVIGNIGAIAKNNQVTVGQKFWFRGIDDVYNSIHVLMRNVGMVCLPNVLSTKQELRKTGSGKDMIFSVVHIEYTFVATDGSSLKCSMVGEAFDSGDKSVSKAASMAHKYALIQAFCIPTADVIDSDMDSTTAGEQVAAVELVTEQQIDAMKEGCKEKGIGQKALNSLLTSYGLSIETIFNMEVSQYNSIMEMIKNYQKAA